MKMSDFDCVVEENWSVGFDLLVSKVLTHDGSVALECTSQGTFYIEIEVFGEMHKNFVTRDHSDKKFAIEAALAWVNKW